MLGLKADLGWFRVYIGWTPHTHTQTLEHGSKKEKDFVPRTPACLATYLDTYMHACMHACVRACMHCITVHYIALHFTT